MRLRFRFRFRLRLRLRLSIEIETQIQTQIQIKTQIQIEIETQIQTQTQIQDRGRRISPSPEEREKVGMRVESVEWGAAHMSFSNPDATGTDFHIRIWCLLGFRYSDLGFGEGWGSCRGESPTRPPGVRP